MQGFKSLTKGKGWKPWLSSVSGPPSSRASGIASLPNKFNPLRGCGDRLFVKNPQLHWGLFTFCPADSQKPVGFNHQ
ncbi:MAG: hypothetical protein B6D64_11910 [Bacteroidetes bacterium 4484_276]|nr:MAG: hypothetical protein B6D64_11910 [Bacteroidetes bacterium 4484_276]